MSKKEIARLRKIALHSNSTPDATVQAFDAAHTDLNRKARVTRKKGEAKAKGEKKPRVTKVQPVAEPIVETVAAPVVETFESAESMAPEASTTVQPAPARVPFARSHMAAMRALPVSPVAVAALAAVEAKVFGKAVFMALPEPVQAELTHVYADLAQAS